MSIDELMAALAVAREELGGDAEVVQRDEGSAPSGVVRIEAVTHAGMSVEMMSEGQLEGCNLDHGELTEWTDANAEERFKAVDGETPPSYD